MAKFLFTTLPTNDLGLLTRSLPIARELAARGHHVLFSSPAQAPSRLIAEAGFQNLLPRHPIYDLMAAGPNLRGLAGFVVGRRWRQRYGSLFNFLAKVIPAIPLKMAPSTPETMPRRTNQGSWVRLVKSNRGTTYHCWMPKIPRETIAAVTDATTKGANRFMLKFPSTIWAANTAPAMGAL